jgi:hypothetical protein
MAPLLPSVHATRSRHPEAVQWADGASSPAASPSTPILEDVDALAPQPAATAPLMMDMPSSLFRLRLDTDRRHAQPTPLYRPASVTVPSIYRYPRYRKHFLPFDINS